MGNGIVTMYFIIMMEIVGWVGINRVEVKGLNVGRLLMLLLILIKELFNGKLIQLLDIRLITRYWMIQR